MATGSISVIDFATRKIVTTWPIGGSPDMGGISPDGTQIWVSGRDDRGCTSSTRARVSG
jgi:DNA-binding beta-propeller fold protein YncE